MNKRINYIDGIKGVCSIFVVMYHFILTSYFAGYVGFGTNFTKEEGIKNVLDNFLSAFLTNNSLGLYVFFVLIAVFPIISFRKKGSNPEVMGRYACKRYFQLFPLCFITSIVMVLLFNAGFVHFDDMATLLNNPWIATTNPDHTNILVAIKSMLFDAWFINTREVGALWCLHMIYRGSLMTYAAYALFGKSKYKYLPTIALFVVSLVNNIYFLFAFGSILGELLADDKETKEMPLFISILLMIVGTIVVKIPNNLYPFELNSTVNGAIGAFLIMIGVIKCEKVKSFFDNKILVFLGRISFEMIIGHVLIMATLSYPVAKWLLTIMKPDLLYGIVLGTISGIISLPLAYLLSKYITPLGGKLAKKVESLCFDAK